MNPYFFGSSEQPLFGAYYAPASTSDRAALIAYPVGHEYMRSHWALRQLSTRLQAAGFHVLRFDYSGTGDSGGAPSLDRWRADLATAAGELRDTSGARRMIAFGVRLGATLLALEAARLGIEKLVLWDPVVSGGAYTATLDDMHRRALLDPNRFNAPRSPAHGERLGFEWPDQLNRAIAAIALAEVEPPRAPVAIASSRGESGRRLADAWTRAGGTCEYREVDDDCAWVSITALEEQVVAPNLVDALAAMA